MSCRVHPCFSFKSYSAAIIFIRARHAEDRPDCSHRCLLPNLWSARAARAAEVAAAHANAVDADSRFPQEALDALKAEKLLGILVPASPGVASKPVSAEVVDVCYTPGPGLFLHRHDLRHASGEGRLRRLSRHGERVAA